MLDSLLQKVEWRRRRTRRLETRLRSPPRRPVLAVALVVGIWPGIRGQGGESEPMASAVTMSKVAQTPITRHRHSDGFRLGTRIDMVCTLRRLCEPRRCVRHENLSMVVVGNNGTQSDVATWIRVNGATAMPSGATLLQRSRSKSVQLVDT